MNSLSIALGIAFLLYSFDFVYNAPIKTSHYCGPGEPLPQRNNAEIFDDVLDINARIMILNILNTEMKNDDVLFYENMKTMAEAALSVELQTDNSHEAQGLQEVLVGVAKDACMWVSEFIDTAEPAESLDVTIFEGSGSAVPEPQTNGVNCSNTSDIVRFAHKKEIEFINDRFPDTNISTDTLSLALRLRPLVTDMRVYLRRVVGNIVPGSLEDKQAWVTRNISPLNRCFVCSTISS